MVDFQSKKVSNAQSADANPQVNFGDAVSKARETFLKKGSATVKFRTHEEVAYLAHTMADLYPSLENALLGLLELLLNAVEHGNLAIGFVEKTEHLKTGTFDQEVKRRLANPQYRRRMASFTLTRKHDQLITIIRDEGAGFNWHPYLLIDERRLTLPTGRGIALANMVCFDALHYNERGNEVTATMSMHP